MNFQILEKSQHENYLDLTSNIKEVELFLSKNKVLKVEIDSKLLNLNQKLYGSTKKESVLIQKDNLKKMMKLFHFCKKFVSLTKRKKIDFSGEFYVENLSNKKNNNDFMISSMLEIQFNTKRSNRFKRAYEVACDYLDRENELNNMCNFIDGKCEKYRNLNLGKNSCCASRCKYFTNERCMEKSLACKIFMCSDAENRGFFFDVNSIPVLKREFGFPERFLSAGLLFNGEAASIKQLKLLKIICLSIAGIVSIALVFILVELLILLI
ncbi:MAG: hypothetical protein IJ538_04545 [Clostridia bacterium]|nr:hypothetical protein [Clostridia bacterium]